MEKNTIKKIVEHCCKTDGISLIELIMTIALMMIILALSTVNLMKDDTYILRTEARRLCQEIRLASHINMTTNPNWKILLDESCFSVKDGVNLIKKTYINKNVKINYESKAQKIGFSSYGAPTCGGTTIEVMHRKNRKYMEITIIPASGRVLLKDEIKSE